jgi:uncharacterized protein
MENQLLVPQESVKDEAAIAHWSTFDTWLGVGILVVMFSLTISLAALFPTVGTSSFFIVLIELILLVPIAIIFAWRKISWKELGFRKFEWSTIGLGCGILALVYIVIIVHNLILAALDIGTQAETIFEVINNLESPVFFFFSGAIMAPLMEETFYRGFLFKGFRQKYGWKVAMLLSSFIFGISHLQLVAFIPTFLLGCVIAYVYHRSNSLFPGMILHFMINAFGLCAAFAVYKTNGIYPIP